MRRTANMTIIGIFVTGSFVLIVTTIILLGVGSFSGNNPKVIAFFDDSVSGLDIGSPVKFRGVTIGKVSQVLLRTEGQSSSDHSVPVVLEFTPDLLTRRGLNNSLLEQEGLQSSIGKGLRAKLQQQSVITGVLYVELDYFPESTYHRRDSSENLPEIPTQPSNLGTLTRAVSQTLDQLSQIDFLAITKKLESILTHIDEGASKIEFGKINSNLVQASANVSNLTGDPGLSKAISDFSAAMQGIEALVNRLNDKVDPLTNDLKSMTMAGRAALTRLNETSENLRLISTADSPTRRELDQALSDVSEAAQAIRSLADFIERNPESIILGRTKKTTKIPVSPTP